MNKLPLIAIAALAAFAGVADARERKPKAPAEPPPPPPPKVTYESDDPRMGEPLETACLTDPPETETFDSNDNMLVVAIEGGGRAFLHLSGPCTFNTLLFAQGFAAGDGGRCLAPGSDLKVSDSFGGSVLCHVDAINVWRADAPSPLDEPLQ